MKPNKKEQKLIDDWKAYNKRMKSSRVPPMSFDDYKNWVNGTTRISKSKFNKEPSLTKPNWAVSTDHIPSVKAGTYVAGRVSMVERALLGLETPEIANEIIKKSKRIGLMYSKGAYSYITDETDIKDLGKKNPTMR